RHDINSGGVYLTPTRVVRQVRRQLATRCVDRGLYIARGCVNIAAKVKLYSDTRTAELTIGSHLRYAGDPSEHTLQWSGNRGGHRFRTCAWKICEYSDGRVFDVG